MPRRKKQSFEESFQRAMGAAKEFHFAGYDFTSGPGGTVIKREHIDASKSGDYGANPIGDGMFKMIPSGDIVDFEERKHRLKR